MSTSPLVISTRGTLTRKWMHTWKSVVIIISFSRHIKVWVARPRPDTYVSLFVTFWSLVSYRDLFPDEPSQWHICASCHFHPTCFRRQYTINLRWDWARHLSSKHLPDVRSLLWTSLYHLHLNHENFLLSHFWRSEHMKRLPNKNQRIRDWRRNKHYNRSVIQTNIWSQYLVGMEHYKVEYVHDFLTMQCVGPTNWKLPIQ